MLKKVVGSVTPTTIKQKYLLVLTKPCGFPLQTYTHCLHDIDSGAMQNWAKTPAPDVALHYWQLPKGSTMRDVILAVRADEANHSEVNHKFSELRQTDTNPYVAKSTVTP